jgi:hypothetical protein
MKVIEYNQVHGLFLIYAYLNKIYARFFSKLMIIPSYAMNLLLIVISDKSQVVLSA